MDWIEHHHGDAGAQSGALAEVTRAAREAAYARDGEAFMALDLAVEGPVGAIRAPASQPGKLRLVATDDRCVPHAHSLSLQGPLCAMFEGNDDCEILPLTSADGQLDASLGLARGGLAWHPQPFDLVVVAMHDDGGFAGLRPRMRQLDAALRTTTGMDVVALPADPLSPDTDGPEISLTLSRLIRARDVHVVAAGAAMRALLDAERGRSAETFDTSDAASSPIAALLHAPVLGSVHVHWRP